MIDYILIKFRLKLRHFIEKLNGILRFFINVSKTKIFWRYKNCSKFCSKIKIYEDIDKFVNKNIILNENICFIKF